VNGEGKEKGKGRRGRGGERNRKDEERRGGEERGRKGTVPSNFYRFPPLSNSWHRPSGKPVITAQNRHSTDFEKTVCEVVSPNLLLLTYLVKPQHVWMSPDVHETVVVGEQAGTVKLGARSITS